LYKFHQKGPKTGIFSIGQLFIQVPNLKFKDKLFD